MSQKNYITPIKLRGVDTAGIAIDTWTVFTGSGLEGSCFFLRITNASDTDVFISYDGVNAHEYLTADDRININFQSNSSPAGYVSKLRKGSLLYVRGVAGTGLVYLSGYYNEPY